MPDIRSCVDERFLATAEEVFDAITPLGKCILTEAATYRGHANSDWNLVPSSFREGALPDLDPGPLPRSLGAQNLREIVDLECFLYGADSQGLFIPGIENYVAGMHLIEDAKSKATRPLGLTSAESFWPPDELIPALALAQHSGARTRLLDWTISPLVAAYFAADTALRLQNAPGSHRASIWICDRVVNPRTGPELSESLLRRSGIFSAQIPNYGNPYMTAQRGSFMFPRLASEPATIVPAEFGLNTMVDMFSAIGNYPPVVLFRKLSFPASEASKLLAYLRFTNTHGGTIYPGYKGAVHMGQELARDYNRLASPESSTERTQRLARAAHENWHRLPQAD